MTEGRTLHFIYKDYDYFRSEVISNTLDPKWRQFKIETRTFCNGDYDRTLQIVVFDKDNDGSSDLIGSFKTNLRK